MKTLATNCFALLVALLMVSCSEQTNPIEPSTSKSTSIISPVMNGPAFARSGFGALTRLTKPDNRRTKTLESDTRLVTPDHGGKLKAKFKYTGLAKKDAQMEANLDIPRGSLAAPATVTLSFDTLTGAISIQPDGLRFLTPASLDVTARDIDQFDNNSIVHAVFNGEDGSFCDIGGQLTKQGNSGKIELKNGVVSSATQYFFATEVLLFGTPDIQTITKNEADSALVLPSGGHATELSAKFEYTAYDGRHVKLSASMTINPGSVSAPAMISMQFDPATGTIAFQPEGLQFVTPALLDVMEENIMPFLSSNFVFVYICPDGTLENQLYRELRLDGSRGLIDMKDAQLNHFSRYGFGRVI